LKYVLFYESAEDVLEKAPLHQTEHGRHMREVQARCELLMTGPFGNPVEEGAMSIFTSRAAAEDCAMGDPFVLNGVVARWYVRDWDEGLD
jgi:uncharacterized protein YciI